MPVAAGANVHKEASLRCICEISIARAWMEDKREWKGGGPEILSLV